MDQSREQIIKDFLIYLEKTGASQTQVAKEINSSKSLVNRIKHRDRSIDNLSRSTVIKLEHYLEKKASELIILEKYRGN